MIRNLALLAGTVSLGLVTPSVAQEAAQDETPHPFVSAISEHTLELNRNESGELSGAGWDKLLEEAERAQFFLIGETHATADIATIASEIHKGIAPYGYHNMVVEIGPWSTRLVEGLIRDGKLTEYVATPGNSFNLPFLLNHEEIALINQAVSLSPQDDHVLWGVDQEFIASGPIIAAELKRLATTDAQRAAANDFAQKAHVNFMYVGAAPQEEIDALVATFADGSEDARKLVNEITLSHRVYGAFVRRTGPIYFANLERENYMKANFLAHFEAAEERLGAPPKAIFKFGGFHMERGLSGTNVPSFGNFVMEWGRTRDFGTVHVMIDCISGEAWAIQQAKPAPCEPYALAENSPVFGALEGRDIALIDLKALRPMLNSSTPIDAKTRDLVLSYDYYLAIRDVKAGTPAGDPAFPPAPRP